MDPIKIDTVPFDVLHVTCIANSREELLDAALRAARRYFGDSVELRWSEAKVTFMGAYEDTWSLDAWATTKDEGPMIVVDENAPDMPL